MIRLSPGSTLVLATHNSGKAREIAVFLAPWELLVFTAEELGLPEPEESGADFRENATLKAKAAAEAAGKTALADDSGLEVLALDGAPGIYSARWAGEKRNFRAAMERLRNELRFRDAREPWTARFVCALAVATPEGYCEVFEGTVQGRCIWPPRGNRGFGYDPMFVPEGETATFGEMFPARKDTLSHRKNAFKLFASSCLPKSP